MHYTIKQMAEMFNVTEYTLRYYADLGLLSCERDLSNRRIFNEESVNWMQGIQCLKGCGASIEDIQEYCRLCLLEESEENLRARYAIIQKQRTEAYKRIEEAKATARYMDEKVAHYEAILAGLTPDDTNPKRWTSKDRPRHAANRFYQYCELYHESNTKQEKNEAVQEQKETTLEKSEEVSIETAFSFLTEGKHIISFVGAGGKSSLIDAIAKWGSNQGKKVLVTTTTHIFKPQSEILATSEKQLQKIWEAGHWAVIGAIEEKKPQKLKMPDSDWIKQAMELADLVLIEADGSKRLPCKVPADHEPVLLPESDIVVAILGLSALRHPLKECCFRTEQAKRLLSEDENHLLTEEDMAIILLSEQGLRKDVKDRRYIAVLNQCDDDTVRKRAEKIGKMLVDHTGQNKKNIERIEKVVFTKLQTSF